jgi:hypothetical protein
MRNYNVGFVTAMMVVLSILAAFQPAYANVAVQIQNVRFSHTMLYAGTYIMSGDSVTIVVTLQNKGDQQTTFVVCPEQMVSYNGVGNGDRYGLLCNSITLGTWWGSSGTVTMQRTARATAPGSLEYRIHVFDATGSEIATSEWYDVVIIAP